MGSTRKYFLKFILAEYLETWLVVCQPFWKNMIYPLGKITFTRWKIKVVLQSPPTRSWWPWRKSTENQTQWKHLTNLISWVPICRIWELHTYLAGWWPSLCTLLAYFRATIINPSQENHHQPLWIYVGVGWNRWVLLCRKNTRSYKCLLLPCQHHVAPEPLLTHILSRRKEIVQTMQF